MTLRNGLAVVTAGVLALLSGGCVGRLIGEGIEGTLGAKGDYREIAAVAEEKDDQALSAYECFELGKVINACGRLVPDGFVAALEAEFRRQLAESDLPKASSGKTLVFNVKLIHYETAGAADNVFGPLEEVVAGVELVDKESGQVIAVGNAVGRTGKTVGLGMESKAEGLTKGLIKWAEDYYPEPAEDEEK